MKREQLESYASELEMENDSMAYLLIKAKKLIELQGICEFNVWWMHDISPILMKDATIDFLNDHKDKFLRRITSKEFIIYDSIISLLEPETFDEFKIFVRQQTLFKRRSLRSN